MFSLAEVKTHTPPNAFPNIQDRQSPTSSTIAAAAAVAGAAVGALLGATAATGKKLDGKQETNPTGDKGA